MLNDSYKHLSHKLLRAFYVVAQEQNITKASKKLFVTQPTISLQIQALELELNNALFERRGPKIILTPAGRKLYELIQPIIMMFEALKPAFEDSLSDIEHGEINIATGQSTSLHVLPQFLQQFQAKYPSIKIRLHNATNDYIVQLVKEDKVDIAISSLATVPYGINYQPFVNYNFSFIVANNHILAKKTKVGLSDIVKYQLILPPREFDIWPTLNTILDKYKLKYSVAIETGGWEIVKKYVALNLGVSIISDIAITDTEDLAVFSASKYFYPKNYGIISRKGKFLSPQINEFIKLFVN